MKFYDFFKKIIQFAGLSRGENNYNNPIIHYGTDITEDHVNEVLERSNYLAPYNSATFNQKLQVWANEVSGQERETRLEAVSRIIDCKNSEDFELKLDRLGLRSLPKEMIYLDSVTDFSANNNLFAEIPAVICKMKNLESLSLSGNQIKNFSQDLKNLNGLKYVILNENQITEITPEIKSLQDLEDLELNSNQVVRVAEEVSELPNLSRLCLKNNPLSFLPESLLARKPQSRFLNIDIDRNNLDVNTLEKFTNSPQQSRIRCNFFNQISNQNVVRNFNSEISAPSLSPSPRGSIRILDSSQALQVC